jgi:hypothetical protein
MDWVMPTQELGRRLPPDLQPSQPSNERLDDLSLTLARQDNRFTRPPISAIRRHHSQA